MVQRPRRGGGSASRLFAARVLDVIKLVVLTQLLFFLVLFAVSVEWRKHPPDSASAPPQQHSDGQASPPPPPLLPQIEEEEELRPPPRAHSGENTKHFCRPRFPVEPVDVVYTFMDGAVPSVADDLRRHADHFSLRMGLLRNRHSAGGEGKEEEEQNNPQFEAQHGAETKPVKGEEDTAEAATRFSNRLRSFGEIIASIRSLARVFPSCDRDQGGVKSSTIKRTHKSNPFCRRYIFVVVPSIAHLLGLRPDIVDLRQEGRNSSTSSGSSSQERPSLSLEVCPFGLAPAAPAAAATVIEEERARKETDWLCIRPILHQHLVYRQQRRPNIISAENDVAGMEEGNGDLALPTFNSNALETVLHRIHGLSRRFLFLNDDFFVVHKDFWRHLVVVANSSAAPPTSTPTSTNTEDTAGGENLIFGGKTASNTISVTPVEGPARPLDLRCVARTIAAYRQTCHPAPTGIIKRRHRAHVSEDAIDDDDDDDAVLDAFSGMAEMHRRCGGPPPNSPQHQRQGPGSVSVCRRRSRSRSRGRPAGPQSSQRSPLRDFSMDQWVGNVMTDLALPLAGATLSHQRSLTPLIVPTFTVAHIPRLWDRCVLAWAADDNDHHHRDRCPRMTTDVTSPSRAIIARTRRRRFRTDRDAWVPLLYPYWEALWRRALTAGLPSNINNNTSRISQTAGTDTRNCSSSSSSSVTSPTPAVFTALHLRDIRPVAQFHMAASMRQLTAVVCALGRTLAAVDTSTAVVVGAVPSSSSPAALSFVTINDDLPPTVDHRRVRDMFAMLGDIIVLRNNTAACLSMSV